MPLDFVWKLFQDGSTVRDYSMYIERPLLEVLQISHGIISRNHTAHSFHSFPAKMRTLEAKFLALLSLLASGASAASFLNTCQEIERAISSASEVFYPGSRCHGFSLLGLGLTQTPIRIISVQRRYPSRLFVKHSECHLQRRTWDSTRRS